MKRVSYMNDTRCLSDACQGVACTAQSRGLPSSSTEGAIEILLSEREPVRTPIAAVKTRKGPGARDLLSIHRLVKKTT